MKIKRINKFILLFLLLGSVSCDEQRVFDTYHSLQENSWSLENSIQFEFSISDTINKHDSFILIRNNQQYPYSNLFLISRMRFPNGKEIVDTLEYEMADATGKFLGTGFSSRMENILYYKENKVFPELGEYSVSISHAMRRQGEVEGIQNLIGITDVGFRIELVE